MSKIKKMLKYVSEHNNFYKNIIHEYGITDPTDITQYPILTRQQLQENRYNMFSDGYKTKYFNQQLRRQSSSGSSGIPVNVYWDYKDWYASNMSLWRKRLQWYGIKPADKYVMFTLSALDIPQELKCVNYLIEPSNLLSFNTSLIIDDSMYDRIIEFINNFQPSWIYIQPFVLNKIVQAYSRTGKKPPKTIKYIESAGELLASDLRRRAVDLFKAPLANMYGSEEMNGIAIENPDGIMEVLDDNVLVEISNEKGIYNSGSGETVITNLNNYAMPLIRYCQNDSISLIDHGKKIKVVNGRYIDTFNVYGKELSTLFLCEVISDINNQYKDPIVEYAFRYNIVQNSLTILIKLKSRTISNVIIDELTKKICNVFPFKSKSTLIIQVCDYILHTKNHILCTEDGNV